MSLMYGFRVSDSTISIIIRQVSEAIIDELAEEVLAPPTTEEEWKEVALQFKLRWQFLHTLGALDGKHIAIQPKTVESVVLACICLHNMMRIRYPGLQNAAVDHEDEDHNVVPGAWREDLVREDVGNAPLGGNRTTKEARA